jgi:hypothetical protein
LQENIQPLREGRKAESLARRFGGNDTLSAQAAKIKEQKEQHEVLSMFNRGLALKRIASPQANIKSQSSDPLASWLDYLVVRESICSHKYSS